VRGRGPGPRTVGRILYIFGYSHGADKRMARSRLFAHTVPVHTRRVLLPGLTLRPDCLCTVHPCTLAWIALAVIPIK